MLAESSCSVVWSAAQIGRAGTYGRTHEYVVIDAGGCNDPKRRFGLDELTWRQGGADDDDIGAIGQHPIGRQEAARPRTMLTPLCVGTPSAGSIDTSTIGYFAGSTPDGMA